MRHFNKINWYSTCFVLVLGTLGTLIVSCVQMPSDIKWILRVRGRFYPVMSDVVAGSDKYYVGLGAESVLALNRGDGALEWHTDVGITEGELPAHSWFSNLGSVPGQLR